MARRRSLFIIVFALLAAPPLAGFAAKPAPLTVDPGCGRSKVKAKLDFPREQVSYDLETHDDFKKLGRPLGLFSARHKIRYNGRIQRGCLKELTVTIAVEPTIHLRAIYTKKVKKCARQIVLDHERGHGRVARAEYKKLAASVEKLVARLFANRRVPDVDTAEAHITDALERTIQPQFQKRYDAAQDKFHGQLAQADIVKKKCRLVKRKR